MRRFRNTKWSGVQKKRCQAEKCKRRVRHRMSDGSLVCRKHAGMLEKYGKI